MKTLKLGIYALTALVFITACKSKNDSPAPSGSGSADFTRYISVGNSLTSGYADNGLYLAGQQNSYPSIIAKQMATVGGGVFNQPLFSTTQANGTGYSKITGTDASGNPVITSVTTNLAYTSQTATVPGYGTINLLTKYSGDIENYGVPSIKLANLNDANYANVNNYFDRLLTTTSPNNNTTYLSLITAKPFTFFTNWLGNNDALGYGTGGGGGYTGADVLTSPATFTTLYNQLIIALTANGQKGCVATIPDITATPFFSTVTVAAVLAGAQAAATKAGVTPPTALYINAGDVTGTTYSVRAATANDLLLLTLNTTKIGATSANSPYPYGLDPRNPIETQYVLDANEVALDKAAIASFNATIKSAAASKGLAVFDANAFLTTVKANGYTANGITFSSAFITGGIFSLDGVHLTPRGYAIVANQFITAINTTYGSTIALANVSTY